MLTAYIDEQDSFSKVEAQALRARLRSIGAEKFIEENLASGRHDVRKLVTAFGVTSDMDLPDNLYLIILSQCIRRELNRRQKLEAFNTLDDAVELLQKSKNIMVVTGAGISTSLGIPDFRSKNTGFYSQLLERGYDSPEDVFDIHNFDDDPR